MELNELIKALENCHNISCDMCPLLEEGVHCMTKISKLLRQEAIKISAANKEIQDLKEEIEELKQENVELDEKLHGIAWIEGGYVKPIKLCLEGEEIDWLPLH